MYDDRNDEYNNLANFQGDYFEDANDMNNFDREYNANDYDRAYSRVSSNTVNSKQQYPNNSNINSYTNNQYNKNSYPTNQDYANNYGNSNINSRIESVNQSSNVMVLMPRCFSEVQEALNALKSNKSIIINLSKLNNATIQRILDYLSGAIFALNGSMQRISQQLYLLTPRDVKIQIPVDIAETLGKK